MTDSTQPQEYRDRRRGLLGVLIAVAVAAPGFAGEPKARTYGLASAPLEIYDRLADLNLGPVPRLADGERKLLATIWERKANTPTAGVPVKEAMLLDAMLVASGIEQAGARRKYRKQFQALQARARAAMKGARDPRRRGKRLMKFLHAGVMRKGYQSGQSSLAAVFNTGKFNCVSAAAMYYVVGSSLGLELRVISIPGSGFLAGHAALDLVDGARRIQVEPTNPNGFDWETKVNRPGVRVFGLVPNRKAGHEVDALGLAAMIYSNRGVALAKGQPPRRLPAVRCYLSALALDPTDDSAAHNLLSVFTNWGPDLAGEKKFEEALRVLGFGLKIAPGSESLHNNHSVVWAWYIEAVLQAGKDRQALTLIRRAAQATKGKDFQSAAYQFSRYGEKCLRESWEAALAVARRGLKVLPEGEAPQLRAWRSGVFRRWSQWLLDQKQGQDVAGSLKVLARGYALDPNDEAIMAGLAYHTQEALRILEARSGLKAVIEHYRALRKQFPKVTGIASVGWSHARRAISRFVDDKQFKEAVAAVDQYEPLLTKPEQRAELGAVAYTGWARNLAGSQEWQAALDKCAEGLKVFPKQHWLVSGLRILVDRWADSAIKQANWDEAIRIYNIGLKYLPGDGHLQHNRQYCQTMKEKK
jgi:tetratricopeptide (TPR) repeat protein